MIKKGEVKVLENLLISFENISSFTFLHKLLAFEKKQ